MAFRNKFHLIQDEHPDLDILIVPECEHPDKFIQLGLKAKSVLWYGLNNNKGLGVFSFGDYDLNLMDIHNEDIKFVCPIKVVSPLINFVLLAVWAQQTTDYDYRHIGQVWKAVYHYEPLLLENEVIIIGDFNSNVIWDKSHRFASHSMTVGRLSEMGIVSVYHKYFLLPQGQELHPTFFLYRHENKPYHIDYCFASNYFTQRLIDVKVGDYHYWRAFSDHSPMTVQFEI